MQPKAISISVVIPAYNAEQHIGRAIDSVLTQTLKVDEIIVVDDGSSDKTEQVIRSYGDKVKYIAQQNAGVSVARNTGIEAAAGNWIAFLDADDEWMPEKIKLQTEHLQRNPDLKWIYSNFYQKQPHSQKLQEAHGSRTLDELLDGRDFFEDYFTAFVNHGHLWTCTVIIQKEVFEKTGPFEPGMKRAQDNDLWYRIAYQYPKIGYLRQPLAVYHLDTPASSTKINDRVDFMAQLVNRHLELSAQYDRQQAFTPCVTHMLGVWIRQLLRQKRYDDAKILSSQFRKYLSPRFQREVSFRLTCPPLTNRIADLIFKLKKIVTVQGQGTTNEHQ